MKLTGIDITFNKQDDLGAYWRIAKPAQVSDMTISDLLAVAAKVADQDKQLTAIADYPEVIEIRLLFEEHPQEVRKRDEVLELRSTVEWQAREIARMNTLLGIATNER